MPDPTERLVSKLREFVESNGARFLVGVQSEDAGLIRHLKASGTPFVTFDGAASYPPTSGAHWTPEGHQLVAERLLGLLSENHIAQADVGAPSIDKRAEQ